MQRLTVSGKTVPFGVVNIDLNGLKTVNDVQGHEAGDRLLVQAGEILRKVFYDEDLFRTGGDEFVIITNDISRTTFDIKVERLRKDMLKNADVSFAIGTFWTDGSIDVTTAFRNADEMMYADKEMFYKTHPELRR
jgi:diguanylate cyclase (GGDEF)-like protein